MLKKKLLKLLIKFLIFLSFVPYNKVLNIILLLEIVSTMIIIKTTVNKQNIKKKIITILMIELAQAIRVAWPQHQ